MNRKLIYGMIALLFASLFLLGCPTDASDDSVGTPPPPAATGSLQRPTPAQAGQNLASALEGSLPGATVQYDEASATVTITLGSPTTIADPINVPEGVTAVFADDVTMTAPITASAGSTITFQGEVIATAITASAGSSVTFEGTSNTVDEITVESGGAATLKGEVTATDLKIEEGGSMLIDHNSGNNGKLVAPSGEVRLDGTLDAQGAGAVEIASGAKVYITGVYYDGTGTVTTNNGEFHILPGGELRGAHLNQLGGNGKVIVYHGGKVYNDGEYPVPFAGPDSDARLQTTAENTELTMNLSPMSFDLNGKATLNRDFTTWGNFSVTLSATSELTLNAELSLGTGTIEGELIPPSDDPGSKINVGDKAITTSTDFYPVGGTVSGGSCVPGKTYVWTADADGVGTAGWKEQP